jgi:Lamin Tail Domain
MRFALLLCLVGCTRLPVSTGVGGSTGTGGLGMFEAGGGPWPGGDLGSGGASGADGGPEDGKGSELSAEVGPEARTTFPTPTAGQLVITEMMPDVASVSDDLGEWFELHNPGLAPLELQGCSLSDSGGNRVTIAPSVVVEAGAYLALPRDVLGCGFPAAYGYGTIKLANEVGGDSLTLSCGGVVVDRAAYTMPVSGRSFSRDAAGVWCLGVGVYRGSDQGTPGKENPVCP